MSATTAPRSEPSGLLTLLTPHAPEPAAAVPPPSFLAAGWPAGAPLGPGGPPALGPSASLLGLAAAERHPSQRLLLQSHIPLALPIAAAQPLLPAPGLPPGLAGLSAGPAGYPQLCPVAPPTQLAAGPAVVPMVGLLPPPLVAPPLVAPLSATPSALAASAGLLPAPSPGAASAATMCHAVAAALSPSDTVLSLASLCRSPAAGSVLAASAAGQPPAGGKEAGGDPAQGRAGGGAPTNLYVDGISKRFGDAELLAAFAPYGRVLSAKVMLHVATGAPRGFGFVKFAEHGAALAAMRALNGQHVPEPPSGDGAPPPADRPRLAIRFTDTSTDCRTEKLSPVVFLRNIPDGVGHRTVRAVCEAFGSVRRVALHQEPGAAGFGPAAAADSGGFSRRVAYVTFGAVAEAERAAAGLHGKRPFDEGLPWAAVPAASVGPALVAHVVDSGTRRRKR